MACMLNLSICHCKRLKLVTTDLLRIDIYRNLTWVCTCSLCSFLSGLREQVVSMCKHIKTTVSWLYLTLHKDFEIFLIKEGGITVQVGQTSMIPLPLLFFHKHRHTHTPSKMFIPAVSAYKDQHRYSTHDALEKMQKIWKKRGQYLQVILQIICPLQSAIE